MVSKLGSTQPIFVLPPPDEIPDTIEDQPTPGPCPTEVGQLELPEVVFGAASFSEQYNSTDLLESSTPFRTVRLALRYGIRAFDTSAYYGPSEIVLGIALKAVELEFPRLSYKLMTKCGRYGVGPADFDYSPKTIRASVMRSIDRLNTPYLDTVYLHDVEYVASPVPGMPADTSGFHALALSENQNEWGLAQGQEARVLGPGDQAILDAIAELRKMQDEGLVKNIGITGYPLPTLLRLALLVRNTAPFKPLDVILSYSQLNVQNTLLRSFAPVFRTRAGVGSIVAASPLSMRLLTATPTPWHPAPAPLLKIVADAEARKTSRKSGRGLADVALGYAYRITRVDKMPMVVGLSTVEEVHASVRAWRDAIPGEKLNEEEEEAVRVMFRDAGFEDWCWCSPPK